MNTLLICGLQVTLVATIGCLMSLAMRRWLRTTAALPIAATLGAVVLLTACAFSSWPSWLHRSGETIADASSQQADSPLASETPPHSKLTFQKFGWQETAAAMWEGLMSPSSLAVPSRSSNVATSHDSQNWTWFQVFGVIFATGIVVGVVRLIGGLWSVRLFVRASRPLKTPELREQVDLLRAEMGCTASVEVRECPHLTTAATVGWRKPVILLSDTWRSWNETQLKSVLAHEIAHITRGDFLTGVAAQLGVVLHFYHPLVHWLVNRLRLEQELAADALAAQVVGGSRAYLNAIGELALRQTNESLGWPAQAFLPTRRTFLRRIEMLRDLKLLSGKAPLAIRAGTLAAIAAVTLVAVGLRPPGGESTAPAQVIAADKPAGGLSGGQAATAPLVARYIPVDADVVLVARVSEVIQAAGKALELFPQMMGNVNVLSGCEQASLFMKAEKGQSPDQCFCLTFVDKAARDQFLSGNNIAGTKKSFLTFEYEVGPGPICCYKPDDKTVVIALEALLQQAMVSGPKSFSPLTQTASWKEFENGAAALAINPATIKQIAATSPPNPILGMLSPLWDSASTQTLGLDLGKQLNITLLSQANDNAGADKIYETLSALVAMGSNIASNMKRGPDPATAKMASEVLLPILESHQLTTDGSQVKLSLSSDMEKLTSLLVVPVAAARQSAWQAVEKNNLKQIMLAMHNYYDVHKHFPAAVVIDPKSGVGHSWRVAILPYLDQTKLYEQYKMNEPWDSEANLKVLAQMPPVFRIPGEPGKTNNTEVVAAYGKNLAFEVGDKIGTKFEDMTDGTSNTICIIATKTEIPWTKPEDILIDVTQAKFPAFGDSEKGFLVGISDGSVRRIPGNISLETLKIILTRNGGEVVPQF